MQESGRGWIVVVCSSVLFAVFSAWALLVPFLPAEVSTWIPRFELALLLPVWLGVATVSLVVAYPAMPKQAVTPVSHLDKPCSSSSSSSSSSPSPSIQQEFSKGLLPSRPPPASAPAAGMPRGGSGSSARRGNQARQQACVRPTAAAWSTTAQPGPGAHAAEPWGGEQQAPGCRVQGGGLLPPPLASPTPQASSQVQHQAGGGGGGGARPQPLPAGSAAQAGLAAVGEASSLGAAAAASTAAAAAGAGGGSCLGGGAEAGQVAGPQAGQAGRLAAGVLAGGLAGAGAGAGAGGGDGWPGEGWSCDRWQQQLEEAVALCSIWEEGV
ncbi:hypothetical protein QJQ45_019444, partial [Haematococcus lacustris]